tara:strand:+ start:184 stop:342 length:159 start_codon:yes stop_codon:yes gene_type:complete
MSKKYWKFFAEKTANKNEELKEDKKVLNSFFTKIVFAFLLLGILAIWLAYFR